MPAQYKQKAPEIIPDCDLYILDFSFDVQTLEKMRAISSSILVLDHHKGAMDDLKNLSYAVFDMERSGAVMAWQHFHPGAPVPDFLLGVQDRDLWNFQLPTTEALSAGLRTKPRDFQTWDAFVKDAFALERLIETGQPVVDANHTYINSMAPKAKKVPLMIEGCLQSIAMINSTYLISDVGNTICKQNPDCFAALMYTITADGVLCSLRSIGSKDVCALAKTFGGGGHINAAGFTLSHTEFFDKFLK